MRSWLPLLTLLGCPAPPLDEKDDGTRPDTEETDVGDTDTEPIDETDDDETDAIETDTDLPPLEVVADGELCFPGPLGDWQACVGLVLADPSFGTPYAYPASSDARYAAPTHYLDLDTLDATLQIAPHFVLNEIAQASKGRFALVQPHLADHLQAMRDALGGPLILNSGYRNPSYNAGVGGVRFSRHQWGDAADMRSSVADLTGVADACEAEGAGYIGWYETHIHCDWRDDPLETALFGPSAATAAPGRPAPPAAVLLPGLSWTAPAEGWDEGEPLREWIAYDANDRPIATATGRSFTPPSDAARVEVVVGRAVRLTREVP